MATVADQGQLPREFTIDGEGWDELLAAVRTDQPDQIVVNMGPQHPSTHGLIRFVLTLDGETVTEVRIVAGYLHTGIEKSMEFRSWTQGVTFCTRMDYLSPFFNEAAYCLAVERLLGIETEVPDRASTIRVLMMELNRVASHLMSVGAFGLELGATTVFTLGMQGREMVLDIMEEITGLRMNHGFIRPGGVAQDIPAPAMHAIDHLLGSLPAVAHKLHGLLDANPIYQARTQGIAYLDLTGCLALGVTGPVLRSAGLPWDLRKSQPYCGYDSYEFDIAVQQTGDVYGRYLVRMQEIDQSLRIIRQCTSRLSARQRTADPVMVADPKIRWPAQLMTGPDGLGPAPEHVRHIMSESMEALIHHFKLITEGFRVPVGQAYAMVESPRGELGCHLVSDGGTRPHRAHFRDPSFTNLQAIPAMCEGGMLADVIAAIASVDPVVGGVDR
ncbi:MAG TPA: NADH-quinone oxidoreductase subunit D [Streptosporangiaceae bacterium]|nr:NADH-quinone oxidoreductase subunit D [Streptosporangiaceae bacterium]